MSPAPPESSANFSEEKDHEFDEVLAPEEGDSPAGMVVPETVQSACPNDDNEYGTWDDMSELEDEGLYGIHVMLRGYCICNCLNEAPKGKFC